VFVLTDYKKSKFRKALKIGFISFDLSLEKCCWGFERFRQALFKNHR